MWFLISVKAFHEAGAAGNRAQFEALVASSETPMGLIAYQNESPVGWCAVGPRSRYARAIKTPTYKGRDPENDGDIWLTPCIFVHKEVRNSGVARSLLAKAVQLARDHGARAIDAFPNSGTKRRSGAGSQVGFEPLFAEADFKVLRTPSPSRVVMRRELR
jgi:GNAT superfamily N-acetyltransferase